MCDNELDSCSPKLGLICNILKYTSVEDNTDHYLQGPSTITTTIEKRKMKKKKENAVKGTMER